MDKKIEQEFVKKYIDKAHQDRLLFELGSEKRRQKAMSRFSHNSEEVLKKSVNKKIIKTFNELQEKEKTVYIISCDENDGVNMLLSNAVPYCESAYMPVILIGEEFSLIKEEAEKGTPKMFYLKCN